MKSAVFLLLLVILVSCGGVADPGDVTFMRASSSGSGGAPEHPAIGSGGVAAPEAAIRATDGTTSCAREGSDVACSSDQSADRLVLLHFGGGYAANVDALLDSDVPMGLPYGVTIYSEPNDAPFAIEVYAPAFTDLAIHLLPATVASELDSIEIVDP